MTAFQPTVTLETEKEYYCAGVTYVGCDDLAAPLLEQRLTRRVPVNPPPHFKDIADPASIKTIGILRAGGIGDLLFITPTIARLLELCPNATVEISCISAYHGLFEHWPRVKPIPYPFIASESDRWDSFINLLKLVDYDNTRPAIDIFAEAAGVTLEQKECLYFPREDELEAMAERYPRKPGVKRIGWQYWASQPARSYPLELQRETFKQIKQAFGEVEIYLFGQPTIYPKPFASHRPEWIRLLPQEEPPPNLRQSAAIIAGCDAFVGPDSGGLHLAGALHVPSVGIYGPFIPEIRVSYAPTIHPLTGKLACAPCFYHGAGFPEGGPCQQSGICNALAQIRPEQIVRTLKEIIR